MHNHTCMRPHTSLGEHGAHAVPGWADVLRPCNQCLCAPLDADGSFSADFGAKSLWFCARPSWLILRLVCTLFGHNRSPTASTASTASTDAQQIINTASCPSTAAARPDARVYLTIVIVVCLSEAQHRNLCARSWVQASVTCGASSRRARPPRARAQRWQHWRGAWRQAAGR